MCQTVPGSWNTGENVCVGDEQPKPSLPTLNPRKGNSRDPAAMEETFAKNTVLPTHLRHDIAESSGQQSEKIVYLCEQLSPHSNDIAHIVFV
jgi:hypothetical protein